MENRSFTVILTRMELTWLYRQLLSGLDRAKGVIQEYGGGVLRADPVTPAQQEMVDEAEKYKTELEPLTANIKERLDIGEKERLNLVNLRADLDEAFELVEEDSAKQEILNRLKEIPKEEPYRIQFDRATAKFTLKLVENDLQKFNQQVIPNYQKAKLEDFTDKIQTKSYWVNKAKRSKEILEQLKIKLEKSL